MFALATVAMLSVSSCMNEKDFDLAPDQGKIESEGYGYISLNVSADRTLSTRGVDDVQNVPSNIVNSWYVRVKNSSNADVLSPVQIQVKDIAAQAFAAPATYKVYVSSHTDLAAALSASSDTEIGAAYYEGKDEEVSVTAAQTESAVCACGPAQNARLIVNTAGFSGTINKLTVSGSNGASGTRVVTFKDNTVDNMSKKAYFVANDDLTYTINYTINGKTKEYSNTTTPLKFTAATENTLTIESNSNGSISLTITYDPTFGTDKTETVIIDAATGEI